MEPTQYVESGEARLAVYSWGKRPSSRSPRPTVLLVHGYPDCAEDWLQVAEQLAMDCYVVAYDVRGAGESSAPKGSKPYALKYLVDDLTAVIDAVSPKQPVHLVGHDWGGLQGWEAVQSKALKGRIASYNALAPALDHVGLWFQSRIRSGSPRKIVEAAHQLLGSSYMAAFQLPLLPELTWRFGLAHQWPRLLNLLEGIQTKPRSSQAADGRFGLGLYRANLMPKLMKPEPRRVDIPVQLLIMERDRFVPERLFTGVESWAPNTQRTHIDAGHWAQLSHPEPLAQAIGDFIQNHH